MRSTTLLACALSALAGCGGSPTSTTTTRAAEEPAADAPEGPTTERAAIPPDEWRVEGGGRRPAWVTSDVPGASWCSDQSVAVVCVGVSLFVASRDEALLQARERAVASLAGHIESRGTTPPRQSASRMKRTIADSLQAPGSEGPSESRYWEEFAREDGDGTEFLGFIRLTASRAVIDRLAGRTARAVPESGSR